MSHAESRSARRIEGQPSGDVADSSVAFSTLTASSSFWGSSARRAQMIPIESRCRF